MFFFIPFPFLNFGNRFFHSLPIPEFWEWFFSFPSHSRIEGMGFFNSLPVPELPTVIPTHPCPRMYCIVMLSFFHSRSRYWVFLAMIASDSHSRIVGMDFFHSLPVPELWEWIFFIPFLFPNFGNRFFHSLPIPEFWE